MLERWISRIVKAGRLPHETERIAVNPFQPYIYPFQSVCENYYVAFRRQGKRTFYAYFQPAQSVPAPLVVHTPGYGAETSMHPEIARRYHVLHISPLGYVTPEGFDNGEKNGDGLWNVIPDTVRSGGEHGYADWLADCVTAISWAEAQPGVLPGRLSFFGTSQGGGGALLLGSVYRDNGARCVAADQPFLTGFGVAGFNGAYAMLKKACEEEPDQSKITEALTVVDTVSHAPRLTMPVLLTGGGKDAVCPAAAVESLYHKLPGTKSYTYFEDLPHGYNRRFVSLASAWFECYA